MIEAVTELDTLLRQAYSWDLQQLRQFSKSQGVTWGTKPEFSSFKYVKRNELLHNSDTPPFFHSRCIRVCLCGHIPDAQAETRSSFVNSPLLGQVSIHQRLSNLQNGWCLASESKCGSLHLTKPDIRNWELLLLPFP